MSCVAAPPYNLLLRRSVSLLLRECRMPRPGPSGNPPIGVAECLFGRRMSLAARALHSVPIQRPHWLEQCYHARQRRACYASNSLVLFAMVLSAPLGQIQPVQPVDLTLLLSYNRRGAMPAQSFQLTPSKPTEDSRKPHPRTCATRSAPTFSSATTIMRRNS